MHTTNQLLDLIAERHGGCTDYRVSKLLGVTTQAVAKWRHGTAVPRLLQILVTGSLGDLDPLWHGYNVRGGLLCGPDGITVTPADVLSVPFVRAQVTAYQARQRFAVQADWIDRRYVEPGDSDSPALEASADQDEPPKRWTAS